MTSELTLIQDFSLDSALTGCVSVNPLVPGRGWWRCASGQLFSLNTFQRGKRAPVQERVPRMGQSVSEDGRPTRRLWRQAR